MTIAMATANQSVHTLVRMTANDAVDALTSRSTRRPSIVASVVPIPPGSMLKAPITEENA